MSDLPFDREEVLERLRTFEETKISFLKLDGDLRDMVATNNPEILADYLPAKDAIERQPSPIEMNLITVFDIEAAGWRSFYLQNLVTIEGVEPKNADRGDGV